MLFFTYMFIYSEKAKNFCKISTIDLSYVVTVKSMVEVSQNFVDFSEYMNFNIPWFHILSKQASPELATKNNCILKLYKSMITISIKTTFFKHLNRNTILNLHQHFKVPYYCYQRHAFSIQYGFISVNRNAHLFSFIRIFIITTLAVNFLYY